MVKAGISDADLIGCGAGCPVHGAVHDCQPGEPTTCPAVPPAGGDASAIPHRLVEPTERLVLSMATSRGEVTVSAVGEIDLCSSPGLQACLAAALDHPSCQTLIVDLRGVRFLGAGGVWVLEMTRLRAAHQNARLAVVADSDAVLRALQIADESCRVGVFLTVPAARVGTDAPRRARPSH